MTRLAEQNGPKRYVVHLTVWAAGLPEASLLARTLTQSMSFLPELCCGETTVSEEGNPGVQHQVFCDRLLDGGRRCAARGPPRRLRLPSGPLATQRSVSGAAV